MMPATIRRATNTDAIVIADVFLAARATMEYLPHVHTEAATRTFITSVVATNETWVAERHGTVVGFAVIDDGVLEHLYVKPCEFGTGVGAMLFAHTKKMHPEGFQLWVFQQNARARRFYERQGCTLVRLGDGTDNEEKLPDALYLSSR
jgi:ribosomal protein S18 acetylase RimI-like enzyme